MSAGKNAMLGQQQGSQRNNKLTPLSCRSILPVGRLNPYWTQWTIHVRVISKPQIRHYGKGNVLMFVDLVDASSLRQHCRSLRIFRHSNDWKRKIKAKAFNETAKKFYYCFEKGKVYFISKAKVKLAHNKYDSLGHEYEIILGDDAEIDECQDNQDNFVSVHQFEQAEKDSFHDFIGVVKSAGDSSRVTFGRPKRDIKMVDRANHVIMVTLWSDHVKIDVSNNPVLVIRGAKVSEYRGYRFLSVIKSSHLEVNPDCEEARELRKWYDGLCHSPRANRVSPISTTKLVQSESSINQSSDLKQKRASNFFSGLGSNKYRKRPPKQSDSSRSRKKNEPSGDESGSSSKKRRTSYSHITAVDVVQNIRKEELIKKFKSMLTDHRTVLLEARDLIDSDCKDSIRAKLRSGQRAEAATELVEYFEANHDGDKMMEFCTFLEDQAGNTAPILKKLAKAIRGYVEMLSGTS